MALDVTLSEECFKNSIKKFFVDSLYTTQGIYIEFDTEYKIPKKEGVEVDQWIVFHFDGLHYKGSVAEGRVAAYLFSRRDEEGSDLGVLRDKLLDLLIDEDATDGRARVGLFDTSWVKQTSMVVDIGDESKQETAKDQTKYRYANLYFKYGCK